MKRLLPAALIATSLVLAACQDRENEFTPPASAGDSAEAVSTAPATTPDVAGFSLGPLPEFFDCVRETGGLLIASHRAGPAPGYPENALETLQYATSQGMLIHEIDVAESRDGVLFLLHDRTLGRTTTGDGAVADTDW